MVNYIKVIIMTKLLNILEQSIKNIINNKLKSLLTMLGLVIGISSVIVLVGLGDGTSNKINTSVKSLGTNILTLSIKSSDTSLDYNQVSDIESIDNITSVAPYKTVSSTVSKEDTISNRSTVIATTPNYLDTLGLTISNGRVLSTIDLENNSKVCLIGDTLATDLFNISNPVGQSIKINGDYYTIIGVLTVQGSSMGNNIDESIIIPFTTAKYLGSDNSINSLYIKVDSDNNISSVTNLLNDYIENTLSISEDYISVSSQDSMLNTVDDINSTMSLLLGGIASISLIVGGIGVMNVMLVSVTERTKEIGIRKALGARRSDILFQFLIEALVICILGGIVGTVLGLGIGNLLNSMGYVFNPKMFIVFISFLSSALIGIIFGIFPANKASKLNPIEALHND